MAKVYFKFKPVAHLTEVPVIVGNTLSLGQWNPQDGCRLTRLAPETGQWCSEAFVLLPMDTDIEYKYVFSQGGKFLWEQLKCNRQIRPTHDSLIVEDEESTYVSKAYVTEARRYSSSSSSSPSPFLGVFPSPGFSEEDHVLIVSFTPPVFLLPDWQIALNPTPWVSSLYQSAISAEVRFQWICILPCSEAQQRFLSEQHHVTAVACPQDLLRRHELFCERVLEPILQGRIDLSPEDLPQYSTELWEGYRGVNSLLADAVMNERQGEDLIWLQDYQVLMTASFLGRRQADPPLNIGLSLHSPFPASDVFKVVPNHEALLNSILACDLVTFQCFDYLRSFLSACKRILGADSCYKENGLTAVSYFGREIALKACYCGVSFGEVEEIANSQDCLELQDTLKTQFWGQKVVFSAEKMDKCSFVLTKLAAFQAYLQANSASKLTLVHLWVLEKPLSKSIQQLQSRVQALAATINAETGRTAVVLREIAHENWQLAVRLAYLKTAQVYWDCTLKGFAPTVVEFAVIHKPLGQPVLISPFSPLVSSLQHAFCVNPFHFQEVLAGFQYADWAEADVRLYDEGEMKQLAVREASNWGWACLSDLKQARKNIFEFIFRPLGLGDKLKQVALRRNFDGLLADKLSTDYKGARNRLILLSNEGALLPLIPSASPQQQANVVQALEELCRDERNSIYVLSNCAKQSLDSVYSGIRSLGLVAEEGSLIKDKYTGFTWQKLAKDVSAWKQIASEVISMYVERLEGAVFVVRETMVVFGYREASQEYGSLLAQELLVHLELVLQPYQQDCELVSETDCIKVRSLGCTKGAIIHKISRMVAGKKGPLGLVLCIGDGPEDEEMFKAMYMDLPVPPETKCVSCTVGMKPSLASHYVHSIQEVWKLVNLLKDHSVKVPCRQTRGSYSQNEILQGRSIGDRNRPILALSISCTQVMKAKDDLLAYDDF